MKKNFPIKHASKIGIVIILLYIVFGGCIYTPEEEARQSELYGGNLGCQRFMYGCAETCVAITYKPRSRSLTPQNEIDKTTRPGDYQSTPDDEQTQEPIEVPKESTSEQQGGASGDGGGGGYGY